MIAQLACGLSIPAFPKHYPKAVAREKAPSSGIDRVFSKSKDVDVVFC